MIKKRGDIRISRTKSVQFHLQRPLNKTPFLFSSFSSFASQYSFSPLPIFFSTFPHWIPFALSLLLGSPSIGWRADSYEQCIFLAIKTPDPEEQRHKSEKPRSKNRMHPNFLGALKVIHGRERKDQKKLLVLLIHRSKENEKKKGISTQKKYSTDLCQ